MPPRPAGPLRDPYLAVQRTARSNLGSKETADGLLALTLVSLKFLATECTAVDLISRVPGKNYLSYIPKTNLELLSRPLNKDLFEPNQSRLSRLWNGQRNLKTPELARLHYTMAAAYGAASDLFDRNNKKGPATYFEMFIGHIFATELGVNPTKRATLPLGSGHSVRMTMDFIFDVGRGQPKIHLPVKMSTRERVVQAWAHQRLLDAAYGHAQYRAILVIHSETKLDLRTREVVEICVPDQWLAYQTLLARMDRIYYLDVPGRYVELSRSYPVVQIKTFADFFTEKEAVLAAPVEGA